MLDLTFGEQVKIVLNRNGMTIKELAEKIENQTGKKMSRQNLTQRLGRDNFQEQDMRMIAGILGCSLQLNILDSDRNVEDASPSITERELKVAKRKRTQSKTIFLEPNEELLKESELVSDSERDMTIGELVEIHEELDALEQPQAGRLKEYGKEPGEEMKDVDTKEQIIERAAEVKQPEAEETKPIHQEVKPTMSEAEVINQETKKQGEINPYTGREYETNSVRIHPKRIGYVQVYDREDGKWADMTEWAFLGFQERKKALLGKAYVPPVYLD